MDWTEYLKLSEKTLSDQFHCDKREELLLHAVMGVITELEELIKGEDDNISKKDEIADAFWYMAIIDRELNTNFKGIKVRTSFTSFTNVDSKNYCEKLILKMYKKSSVLLDFLKKKLYYNKEIKIEEFKFTSVDLFATILDYCNYNDIDVPEILDTNIAKLKARYGDKFSSDKAINRDLETERNILESKEDNKE